MRYIDLDQIKFLLHQVHPVGELLEYEHYSAHDEEAVNMMLDAALQLADTFLFPFLKEMDQHVPDLEKGSVQVHPQIEKILNRWGEDGWYRSIAPYEWDGMQLPISVNNACRLIFQAANNGAFGYTGSTVGAANLVLSFASDELKSAYLPHMYSGKWPGTMALTEPDAGSSLSDITTEAVPTPGGHYLIKGQKIFISGGDQHCVENVVHLMLARIQGAPKGTKGISLFIVPKNRLEEGKLVSNDVVTAGVFHKMGQRATPAVHLVTGEKDNCFGWLVGAPNRGLSYMFQMMNEERLDVGGIATAIAAAAYHASLKYARERPQGRLSGQKNPELPQTLIVNHPDVKRMLLLQKSIVEGSMSLLLQCAHYADLIHVASGPLKEESHLLLELLTPIAKSYPAEAGIRAVSNGLQVLGGYGYCEDFPLEQLYRDIRICPIYEGTTGIQAQDLLGRKVMQQNGRAFKLLSEQIQQTLKQASAFNDLQKYAKSLKACLEDLHKVTRHLATVAQQGKVDLFLSDATLYLEFFGLVVIGWQWLKQATIAKESLISGNHSDQQEFYESKILTMRFFFAYELRKTTYLRDRLLEDDEILTLTSEKSIVL